MRHRHRDETPQEQEGRARVRAAKLCSTSFYLGITGCVLLFVPFVGGGPIAAAAAVITGIAGLTSLARLGPAPRDLTDLSPIERVGARMAARGKGQAGTGIGLGLLVVLFFLFTLWQAHQAQQRRQEAMEDHLRQFEQGTDGSR